MALRAWVSIKGAKQGQFKAETSEANRKDKWIPILAFSLDVLSPHDIATGAATGKRQWKPILIVKKWGAATPQLLQAATTNEILEPVILEFEKAGADGKEYVYQTVTLNNATLTEVREHTPDSTSDQKAADTNELEDVQFTFQKIHVENKDGKTTFTDSWLH